MLLGLVIVLVLGVSLTSTNPGVTPFQWAEHYQIGSPPLITYEEIPFIDFIPAFGPKTIQVLRDHLPIISESQLRAIDGIGEQKVNMLLALYALSGAEEPPTTTEEGSTGAAIAVGRVIYVVDGDTFYVEYILTL